MHKSTRVPTSPWQARLPNEDAQSFVFDATTLFERDKFSGYDRIEGGTRANVGFQYTGTFDNGYKLHGIFGQSYQLAGQNSFATDDLVNAGANSGLETDPFRLCRPWRHRDAAGAFFRRLLPSG